MKEKLTIKQLFDNILTADDIDVITVYSKSTVEQCDNYESITNKDAAVDNYEIDYDVDMCMVYLDIYAEV